ncbi:hypothetical protein TNCV_4254121 [Trichonephila clavipes]|nr:hypothetical protein TNCV_4254121 [Trichonephila clavipes]
MLNCLHGYLAVVQPSGSSFTEGCWLYVVSPLHKILQKTPLVLTITIQPTREERVFSFRFFFSALVSIQPRFHLGPLSPKKITLLYSRGGSTTPHSSPLIDRAPKVCTWA